MNMCNAHFHDSAEEKGGEFTQWAGKGDGRGHQTGYWYPWALTAQPPRPLLTDTCGEKHGSPQVGDTIERHYVHSSAQVKPTPYR